MTDENQPAAANNPAGRTLEFLERLMPYAGGHGGGDYISQVLDAEFGLGSPGSSELQKNVTKVRMQAEAVPSDMEPFRDIPGFKSIFEHYKEILAAMVMIQSPSSYIPNQVSQAISKAGWASLRFADEVLSKQSIEKGLDPGSASRYVADVRTLIDEITADESLSAQDRSRLVRLLRAVEDALVNIRIYGANHVEEAAATVAGVVSAEKDLWDRIADKKWVKRFAQVIGGLLLALGAVGGIPAIESMASDAPTEVVVVQQEPPSPDGNGVAKPSRVVDGEIVEAEIVDSDG